MPLSIYILVSGIIINNNFLLIRIEGNIKQNPQESMQRSSNEVEFFQIYTNVLHLVRYNNTHIGGAPT